MANRVLTSSSAAKKMDRLGRIVRRPCACCQPGFHLTEPQWSNLLGRPRNEYVAGVTHSPDLPVHSTELPRALGFVASSEGLKLYL
jgi:hypothetical protein